MAGTAVLGRLSWLVAEVVDTIAETNRVKTIVFDVPGWMGHHPGQHVDVRLTAEDGYQAQRSYSIASVPDGTRIELTVERLENGEVSPYLTDELRSGDQIELLGPIGGYFVWEPSHGGPLLLVAGGSGVVPLAAMIRHRAHVVVLSTGTTVLETTKTVQSCASCHVMDPFVNDLFDEQSTTLAARHYKNRWISEYQCYTCHTTYGAHGTFEGKRDGFRHWLLYVTNTWEEPITFAGSYPNQNCTACHGGAQTFRKVDSHRALSQKMMANEVSCTSCHGPAHPTPAATTGRSPASCCRTRTSCASTAPSAIRSPLR
jgi:nitrate/TMAO reductase-like tetraheme cytochrome c subunit